MARRHRLRPLHLLFNLSHPLGILSSLRQLVGPRDITKSGGGGGEVARG
jgi:hypothetical protein